MSRPSLRVVVASTDDADVGSIGGLLRQWGHDVAAASTDAELLALLGGGQTFDLAVLGQVDEPLVDLVRSIRKMPTSSMRILVLMTPGDREELERWIAAGVDDCLDAASSHPAASRLMVATSRATLSSVPGVPEDLLLARLRLADRMASMGQLAAGIGHELNNPLSYVLLNLDAALGGLERAPGGLRGAELAELRSLVRGARDGAERMRAIVGDLKTLSRPERGGEVGPVRVRKVVDAALRMTHAEIRRRAQLVSELTIDAWVSGRESELAQVLINLLVNAAHAIRPGQPEQNTIIVRVEATDATVVLTVSDTGCGIAAEHRPYLFQPFFTTKGREGTGLGLPICYRIVDSLGGEIAVDSEVGGGTEVRITFPRAAAAPDSSRQHEPVSPEGRLRILLVDDDKNLALSLKRLLSDHDVVYAGEGDAALGILASDPCFDVILCDLMMPGVTGMDIYEWVLANRPELPARMLFLTGGAYTQRMRDFLGLADVRCLHKPFTYAELGAAIQDLPALRKSRSPAPGEGGGDF